MSAPLPFRGQYRASWRTLLPVGRRFRRNRLAVGGAVALGVVLAGAFLAPLLARHDPTTTSTAFYQAPSAEHWFGTDNAGRDLFARVLYGARVSLRVGLGSTLVALAIGVGAGTAAGYFGRGVDALVMRATDVFLSFPPLLLAFAFVAATGQGEGTVVLVLGLAGWATMARVLRASIQTVMTTDYVAAARAMGCPDRRVIARHVLPNAIQPLLVVATIFAGTAILGEAALSFL
ncbi:MAG: ABC transporter permease, partial [Acidimicrobiales bacterium]